MQIAIVVTVYAMFSIFEFISIKKTGENKDLALFIFLITFSFVFSLLLSLDFNIPSIDKIVGDWILAFYK